jgi:hypothetical protein
LVVPQDQHTSKASFKPSAQLGQFHMRASSKDYGEFRDPSVKCHREMAGTFSTNLPFIPPGAFF